MLPAFARLPRHVIRLGEITQSRAARAGHHRRQRGRLLRRLYELRLPLRRAAILYGELLTDFAITSGVHGHQDVLKSLMAGAKVAMMASELLQHGVGRITEVLRAPELWMEEHEYVSVNQMIGSMSRTNVADPSAFERATT